jgi:uncharacterized membrane protein
MQITYNRITGQSVERLAALSDGIFAFAMTLLVLEMHGPSPEAVHSERELWLGLCAMMPQLITWLMSFLTLGIFWAGQQAQLNQLDRCNRHLAWIHLGFLCAVSVLPFSTRLLTEFIVMRTALLVYWANILMFGVVLYVSWKYAIRAGLVRKEIPAATGQAIERRILGGQALYALGAALCVFNPYVSIGFIVLVQLNFAIAPGIPGLRRI